MNNAEIVERQRQEIFMTPQEFEAIVDEHVSSVVFRRSQYGGNLERLQDDGKPVSARYEISLEPDQALTEMALTFVEYILSIRDGIRAPEEPITVPVIKSGEVKFFESFKKFKAVRFYGQNRDLVNKSVINGLFPQEA